MRECRGRTWSVTDANRRHQMASWPIESSGEVRKLLQASAINKLANFESAPPDGELADGVKGIDAETPTSFRHGQASGYEAGYS